MTAHLAKIFAPQLTFEGVNQSEKFLKLFCDLYRIELFKDGLDLILTKVKEKHLGFEVRIINGWDTNLGCFLTEQKNFYDKTLGRFFRKKDLKIILRNLSHNLLAHEMAHAWDFESGLDLGAEFRKAIGFDMKDREAQTIPLRAEIKRLMVEALKSYPPEQFLSELFARYFELLSISRDVHATGDFTTAEVMAFFENTTNYIEKIFNPQIRGKIDPQIAQITSEIARQVKLAAPEKKFQERVDSFHKRSESTWSKNVKSNANFQNSWNKYQALEDAKDKK
jgi:hypothetical protein